jgi:hypothetical protein
MDSSPTVDAYVAERESIAEENYGRFLAQLGMSTDVTREEVGRTMAQGWRGVLGGRGRGADRGRTVVGMARQGRLLGRQQTESHEQQGALHIRRARRWGRILSQGQSE